MENVDTAITFPDKKSAARFVSRVLQISLLKEFSIKIHHSCMEKRIYINAFGSFNARRLQHYFPENVTYAEPGEIPSVQTAARMLVAY